MNVKVAEGNGKNLTMADAPGSTNDYVFPVWLTQVRHSYCAWEEARVNAGSTHLLLRPVPITTMNDPTELQHRKQSRSTDEMCQQSQKCVSARARLVWAWFLLIVSLSHLSFAADSLLILLPGELRSRKGKCRKHAATIRPAAASRAQQLCLHAEYIPCRAPWNLLLFLRRPSRRSIAGDTQTSLDLPSMSRVHAQCSPSPPAILSLDRYRGHCAVKANREHDTIEAPTNFSLQLRHRSTNPPCHPLDVCDIAASLPPGAEEPTCSGPVEDATSR